MSPKYPQAQTIHLHIHLIQRSFPSKRIQNLHAMLLLPYMPYTSSRQGQTTKHVNTIAQFPLQSAFFGRNLLGSLQYSPSGSSSPTHSFSCIQFLQLVAINYRRPLRKGHRLRVSCPP